MDLNLLHSYDDGSEITEKELIENQCGIQLNEDSYICSYQFSIIFIGHHGFPPQEIIFGDSSNIELMLCWGWGGSEFLLEHGVTLTKKINQCLTDISQF